MDNRTSEVVAAALGGATFGAGSGLTLFSIQFTGMIFPLEFAFKLLGTCILAAVGGIVGIAARDLYTHAFKDKWVKFINRKKDTDNGANHSQPEQQAQAGTEGVA